jgi:hypothetical protein
VIPWASFARIAAATLVVIGAARSPLGSIPVIAGAPILGIAYLLTLVLLREWTVADLKAAMGRSPNPA